MDIITGQWWRLLGRCSLSKKLETYFGSLFSKILNKQWPASHSVSVFMARMWCCVQTAAVEFSTHTFHTCLGAHRRITQNVGVYNMTMLHCDECSGRRKWETRLTVSYNNTRPCISLEETGTSCNTGKLYKKKLIMDINHHGNSIFTSIFEDVTYTINWIRRHESRHFKDKKGFRTTGDYASG